MAPSSLQRILDANANRALEGLRVCEEVIRLHVESPAHFRRARALRHAIAAALNRAAAGRHRWVAARDSRRDAGRRAASGRVASLEQLLLINFQRTKEALRTLEECSRLAAPRAVAAFQEARFALYDLERDVLLHVAAVRHPRPRRRRRA